MSPRCCSLLAVLGGILAVPALLATPAESQERSRPPTYAQVKPILDKKCIQCHGAQVQSDGIRLDTYEHVMRGKPNKRIVIAGKPNESDLILSVTGKKRMRMPLGSDPLPQAEIDLLTRWVAEGAQR